LPSNVTHDRFDHHPVVGQPLLAARSNGQPQQPRELGGGLGVAEVG